VTTLNSSNLTTSTALLSTSIVTAPRLTQTSITSAYNKYYVTIDSNLDFVVPLFVCLLI
jgi:hypothetical protein